MNKKNYGGIIIVGLSILLILSIFTGGFGINSNTKEQVAEQEAPLKAAQQQQGSLDINMVELVDDDDFKGDEDAPVTIVEWSDFECPFCTRFYTETLGKLEEKYINTGKVKFVYRDFPLGFHANAQKAAEAAECAGEQGKYWEMHDKLFEKQAEWSEAILN